MNNKKNILKKEKGITLIALVITIIVLIIITTVGVHTSLERLKGNNVNKLFNDIEFLEDKTLEYYVENGELPILSNIDYPNISGAGENATNLKIIDLSKLGNISLNFGQDFEKLKTHTIIENTNYDVYVINEQTQQIFYSKGITANKITYYTKDNRDVQILISGDDKIVLDVKGEKIDPAEIGKDEETNINYYEEGIDSYYCTVKVRYKIVKNKLNNNNLKVDIYYGETKENITMLKESIEQGIKELPDAGYYEIKLGNISLKKIKITHKWRNWSIKKQSTCVEIGEKIRTCEVCGKEETKSIEKIDHNFGEWTITKEPTCIEKGISTRTCTACGKEESQEIKELGHSYGSANVEYTMNSNDKIAMKNSRICTRCGYIKSELNETGIKFGDYVQYTPGSRSYTSAIKCSVSSCSNSYHSGTEKTYSVSTTSSIKWRILGVEDGKLLITGASSTPIVHLGGLKGYYEGVDELNTICSELYGHGEHAEKARNLNYSDIAKHLGGTNSTKTFKYTAFKETRKKKKYMIGSTTTDYEYRWIVRYKKDSGGNWVEDYTTYEEPKVVYGGQTNHNLYYPTNNNRRV